MGQNSSKSAHVPQNEPPKPVGGFGRAQTMLDVTQATLTSSETPPLQRSSSDTALNASAAQASACQKSYQQALEWGRNEHFFKLAHTFHTNNY